MEEVIHMIIHSINTYTSTAHNTITIIVIANDTRKILLLQRNPDAYPNYIDPFPRFWELIGGGVNANETPEDAARREAKEEANIQLVALQLIGISPFTKWNRYTNQKEPANNWIYVAFVEEEYPITISNEHLGFQWHSLAEVQRIALAFKHSAIVEIIRHAIVF